MARIIPMLIFIGMPYRGMSVPKASLEMDIPKRLGYIWLDRWNRSGVEDLVPASFIKGTYQTFRISDQAS